MDWLHLTVDPRNEIIVSRSAKSSVPTTMSQNGTNQWIPRSMLSSAVRPDLKHRSTPSGVEGDRPGPIDGPAPSNMIVMSVPMASRWWVKVAITFSRAAWVWRGLPARIRANCAGGRCRPQEYAPAACPPATQRVTLDPEHPCWERHRLASRLQLTAHLGHQLRGTEGFG